MLLTLIWLWIKSDVLFWQKWNRATITLSPCQRIMKTHVAMCSMWEGNKDILINHCWTEIFGSKDWAKIYWQLNCAHVLMWELHDSTKGDKYFIRRGFSWFIEAWYQLYNLCYINGVKNFGGKIEDQYDPTKNQCIQWRSLLIHWTFNKMYLKNKRCTVWKSELMLQKGFKDLLTVQVNLESQKNCDSFSK